VTGRVALDAEVRGRLSRAVRRFAPPWMGDRVEDLVQTAAVRILRGSPSWTLDDPLLRRIAYSVVIDELRRCKRRPEAEMSPSMPDRIANSTDLSPELRAHGAGIGEVVVTAVQALSEDRRRAVTLYLQDHTVPEIADLLGWDFKRASNCVYRGLGDLRRALEREGVLPIRRG
jgi:RNA polymerase sigma-70 factor (ECF subfamily)